MSELEKSIIANNRNFIASTCVDCSIDSLKRFAKSCDNNVLELIQLHKGYCSFDGWSEKSLTQYGFKLLFAEIPQRRTHMKYNHKFTNDGVNMSVKLSSCYIFPEHIHDKTENNLTLAERYCGVLKDPNFRPLFVPEVSIIDNVISWEPAKSFKTPLILRKLIMLYEYADGKYDVYHWHKTAVMRDNTGIAREVKTILTHVNGIEVRKIFSNLSMGNLQWRVLKYASLISTEDKCQVREGNVTIKSNAQCLM